MKLTEDHRAFLTLVRAGLWEREVKLSSYKEVDFNVVYKLAQEQSVVGLVAAGIEHLTDTQIAQTIALQFVGDTLQLEQRNNAMNTFVAELIEKLRKCNIHPLLVKGQGIAQCYERPLWRASGDIDLFLSQNDYDKAIQIIIPFASNVEENRQSTKHIGMTIDKWEVELHGTLRCQLGKRIDDVVDKLQEETFRNSFFRPWENDKTQVLLPNANEDVVFVFTHILQHLYRGGIGIRQVCDWCRLLWTYKDSLDVTLLDRRLHDAGIMTEWKTFAAFVVEWLGMPAKAMPLYSTEKRWRNKAEKILAFMMETGNFGHNRDMSYLKRDNIFVRKIISFWKDSLDSLRLFWIFPKDAIRVWFILLNEGIGKLERSA